MITAVDLTNSDDNQNGSIIANNASSDSTRDVDDGYASDKILKTEITSKNIKSSSFQNNSDYYGAILHSANLYRPNEINLYDNVYRFGLRDPYNALVNLKEFLFFTKPDLHIMACDDNTGTCTNELNDLLSYIPFWADLATNRPYTVMSLQSSYMNPNGDPFMHILQNQVTSSLDIPGINAGEIETAVNSFGIGYTYRGGSSSSDDNPEFSLEFRDNKWLETYYVFKAYDEYERLKKYGRIRPCKIHITNRELHDQFAIYKFMVDEDMETIIYWGKMYGVFPKSLPRDAFSNTSFDNGLSFSVDFKAAFYEDLTPEIIGDFNYSTNTLWNQLGKSGYNIGIYNGSLGTGDMRLPQCAHIVTEDSHKSPSGFVYKLKWRGVNKI